jgi:MFS family permease
MGVGEATFYPSALSLLSRRVPPLQRARATATMQFGAVVGPAIGTLLGGLLMVRYGWRTMFVVMGLASLVWLVAWRRWMRRSRTDSSPASAGEDPPYVLILRQRALWGGMMGTFCSNYAFYFVFSWLPLYLVHERGLSLAVMTQAASAFYVVDGASVLLAGWLLDRWIRRGATFNRAYKTALVLSSAGVGACLIASSLASGLVAAAVILLLTGVMDGLNSPANPSVTQTFAGPWATGPVDGPSERRRQYRGDDGPGRDRLSRAAHGPLHCGTHRVRRRGTVWTRGMAGRRPGDTSDRLVG